MFGEQQQHITKNNAQRIMHNTSFIICPYMFIIEKYRIPKYMCGCLSPERKPATQTQPITVGEYKVIKQAKLGEGAYGQVWKCRDSSSNSSPSPGSGSGSNYPLYALKQILLQTEELKQMYNREVRILSRCNRCPHIIKLLASTIILSPSCPPTGLLLFQLGTITLHDQISSKHMSVNEISQIGLQLVSSLEELHSLQIYHLDVKPQNAILVGGVYKLCDFGSAIQGEVMIGKLSKRELSTFSQYIQSNSTLIYRSPQMITLSRVDVISASSDVWMLGCVLYMLLHRRHPFAGQGKLAILSGIQGGKPSTSSSDKPKPTPQDKLDNTISGMLKVSNRLTLAEVRERLQECAQS